METSRVARTFSVEFQPSTQYIKNAFAFIYLPVYIRHAVIDYRVDSSPLAFIMKYCSWLIALLINWSGGLSGA